MVNAKNKTIPKGESSTKKLIVLPIFLEKLATQLYLIMHCLFQGKIRLFKKKNSNIFILET